MGRFVFILVDELIVVYMNEIEYCLFIVNKKNEVLYLRIIVMLVFYNLWVSEEEYIYEKMICESDVLNVYIVLYIFCVVVMFIILICLKDLKCLDIDLIKKMCLYDGEMVEGYNVIDVEEL